MRSRVRRTLTVAFVALLALEVTLHLASARLSEPQFWYAPDAQVIVDGMDRLSDAGVKSDLVLAGSSMVQFGLRPSQFEEELASIEAAHNVGIPKGYPTVMRRWLLEEVEPRLQPGRVVWGLSSLDFNGGNPTPALAIYEEVRAGAPGFFGEADRWLWSVSMTARYRDALREPRLFLDLLESVPPVEDVELADLLEPTVWPDVSQTPKALADLRNSILLDFHVGEDYAADFEFTIDALREAGIEVVVALLPVSQPYIDAHPGGEVGYLVFVEWIEAETARLGVPLLIYDRSIPEDQFLDFNHITPDAAAVLTDLLVADLQALGW
jgi:hypothetical protein